MRRRMRSRRLSTSFCARETMAAGPSKQFDALAIERLRGPGRIKVFVSGIGFSWKFASPEAGFAIKENASVIVFSFAALVGWSISLDACFHSRAYRLRPKCGGIVGGKGLISKRR